MSTPVPGELSKASAGAASARAIPAGLIPGSAQHLKAQQAGVVRRRDGGVLTRGFILKTDHYPTGRALDLSLNLVGAPNFRGLPPKHASLGVYGVAQPTVPGLKTLLSLLLSSPASAPPRQRTIAISTREEPVLYISGRPFVLRDSASPTRTLGWAGSSEGLEAVEERLKRDVLREGRSFGGVVLAHEELFEGGKELIPTWIQVDESCVKTVREVYEEIAKEGFELEYHRIPISPAQPIENNYLDAYLSVLKGHDPRSTSVVINCGMGVVRTTFAMTAAVLIRRHQIIRLKQADTFTSGSTPTSSLSPSSSPLPSIAQVNSALQLSGTTSSSNVLRKESSTPSTQAERILENAVAQHNLNRSLLRLTHMLDKALEGNKNASASSLLSTRPQLLDSLRSAHIGNYQVILALLGCLDDGKKVKVLVDNVIDACDAVTNLREEIIYYRIQASLDLNDKSRQSMLDKASKSLEKYFFLISFAAFIEDSDVYKGKFSEWLKNRAEIWNQIMLLRRGLGTGSRLYVFAPVADLSVISRSSGRAAEPDGGQVLGEEWAEHVVANRTGVILRPNTLLKSDQWLAQTANSADGVRGALGFRQIPGSNVFCVGQPTEDAIDSVLAKIKERVPGSRGLLWINLREEPLVYINGQPFCLRKENFSLRNIKDYSGVSPQRLAALEDRLKDDVLNELRSFEGCLLLHSETSDGVIPVWEDCDETSVASVREIMEGKHADSGMTLTFKRLPMTSEKPPDFSDIKDLMEIVLRTDLEETPVILNDQLGRGRSTVASVIVLLTQDWLARHRSRLSSEPAEILPYQEEDAITEGESTVRRSRDTRQHARPVGAPSRATSARAGSKSGAMSWQVINNVLRVVRNGLEVKDAVDHAIDRAGQHINLRDCIEDTRARAAEATDPEVKKRLIEQGIHHLSRYFELVIYQAYLEETMPDTFENLESFETFVKNRPVFRTFQKELKEGGMEALAPIARLTPADGIAMSDETETVVLGRKGQILSASTILKSDFFLNLQKLSLPDRVEGAPNFRKVPLTLSFSVPTFPKSPSVLRSGWLEDGRSVYGTGMPSAHGLRRALEKMNAGPGGAKTIYWTSLREEPVIYVSGRPHVLRLQDRPLVNVEATGITTDIVEAMEISLKKDVIREIKASEGGRILLHDEVETSDGSFEIVPIWESVSEKDVMTPKEVYDLMFAEGYHVNYARIAITDEQAPLPVALGALVQRVVDGYKAGANMAFNCQMGRGRTTTGMIAACLTSSIISEDEQASVVEMPNRDDQEPNPYLNGEYKTILSLVSVLSSGKLAKRLADRAINQMDGVQNLRKAVYDYKLKADASPEGSTKQAKLHELGVQYLYRYGFLIVLANFVIETRAQIREAASSGGKVEMFHEWLRGHREIKAVLSQKSLE